MDGRFDEHDKHWALDHLMTGRSDGERVDHMGMWGIWIDVDAEFIQAGRELAQDAKFVHDMQRYADSIVARNWPMPPSMAPETARLMWSPESVGLRVISVPGNACSLNIDGFDAGRYDIESGEPLAYSNHNVDGPLQQACLLAIFLDYARMVGGHIREKAKAA